MGRGTKKEERRLAYVSTSKGKRSLQSMPETRNIHRGIHNRCNERVKMKRKMIWLLIKKILCPLAGDHVWQDGICSWCEKERT